MIAIEPGLHQGAICCQQKIWNTNSRGENFQNLEDGKFLMITDRKKEIFKLSNGKYVAPQPIENKIKESEFVDQVMVTGEGQKFASALVVPDFTSLSEWSKSQNLPSTRDPGELLSMPDVKALFNKEFIRLNKTLPEPERILGFRIVSETWTPDTGELSASFKLRRKFIEDKNRDLLDSIYRR